jgi:hypothetical protein
MKKFILLIKNNKTYIATIVLQGFAVYALLCLTKATSDGFSFDDLWQWTNFWISVAETLIFLCITICFRTIFNDYHNKTKEQVEKINETRITISERQTIVESLKYTAPPLYLYFSEVMDFIANSVNSLQDRGIVEVDNPLTMYNAIIQSCSKFTKSIYSVDCNMQDWVNICEYNDLNTDSDVKKKREYDESVATKRRTDGTYKIYTNIKDRVKELSGTIIVQRIFVLQKKEADLDNTEKGIIERLKKLEEETKGRIKKLF